MNIEIFFGTLILAYLIGIKIIMEKEKKEMNVKKVENNLTPTYLREEFSKMVEFINDHRELNGLNKLTPESFLTTLAKNHTEYMVNQGKASHDYALLRDKEAKDFGYSDYAEITAKGYNNIESLFNGYFKSYKHNKAMLKKEFNYIGIFISRDEKGVMYNTITFGEHE